MTHSAAYVLLFILPRSQVLEGTPNIHPNTPGQNLDNNLNFVLRDQNPIIRQRLGVGARLEAARFTASLGLDYTFAGSSKDNAPSTNEVCSTVPTTDSCDSVDKSGSQVTVNLSLGFAL